MAAARALSRWDALTRYIEDGHIEIDNNAAERSLRGVALGRKNYLFAGSDAGGEDGRFLCGPGLGPGGARGGSLVRRRGT